MKKFTSLILAIILCISLCATASAIEIPDGAYGVLWIPCLQIRMPIYASPVDDHDHRQAVIDAEDSALLAHWGTAYEILDHFGSECVGSKGEWNIQKVFSGAYAFYYTKGHSYMYECYLTAMTAYDGNEYINGRLLSPHSSYDLLTVCCAGNDSHHHYVAAFRRLKEY